MLASRHGPVPIPLDMFPQKPRAQVLCTFLYEGGLSARPISLTAYGGMREMAMMASTLQ